MRPFLLLLLLLNSSAFAQQADSSFFIINGLVGSAADTVGIKIYSMKVLDSSGTTVLAHRPGRKIVLIRLKEETFDIAGFVKNDQGQPLRAKIYAGQSSAANINDAGRFYIRDVPAGSIISFVQAGYKKKILYIFKAPKSLLQIKLQPL